MAYLSATSDDEELADGEKKTATGNENDRRSPPPINVPFKKGAVKELNPVEVRWFHKLSKGADWLPFGGRDSLLIEVKRRLELKEPMLEDFPMKSEIIALCSSSIVVLDGYYELILDQAKIKPIYWAGPSLDIMRGTWFTETDWSPLDDKLAVDIENQHVKMFRGQNIPDSPVYSEKSQKPILHTLLSNNCKVEWSSIIDVQLQPKDRTWLMSLRIKSTLMKIRRGYHTEATYEDGPLPVNHLLLVVHGIGQKRLVNQIISNATSMRLLSDKLLKQSYGHVRFRPMFLPVEWRLSLKLEGDLIEAITPNSLISVRYFLNNTAMDIMYYSSPTYQAEVSAGLVSVFNKLYSTFLKHNPYFPSINGSVSIVAHSLGSVLSYDVISNWSPLLQYEEYVTQRLEYLLRSNLLGADLKKKLKDLQQSRKELEQDVGGLRNLINLADAERAVLKFKVANLFCLGSPLSVYLALRGQKGRSVLDSFQPVIFNIFNANDPVAYRLEPLVHPLYAKVSPLRIHKFDSRNQTPYQEMPIELISTKPATSTNDKNGKKKRDQTTTAATATVSSGKSNDISDSTSHASHDATMAVENRTMTSTNEAENKADIPRRSWSAAVLSKFRSSPTPVLAKNVAYTSNDVAEITLSDEGPPSTTNAVVGENSPVVAIRSKTVASESSASASRSDETASVSDKKAEDHAVDADLLASLTENEKLPYRVDFVVKAPTLNPLDMVLSHTNYWQKEDIVMFILSQLYGVSPRHAAKI